MKNLWNLIFCFFVVLMSLTSCELLDEFKKDSKEEKEEEKVMHDPLLFGVWKEDGPSTLKDKWVFNENGSGYAKYYGGNTYYFVWESPDGEIRLNYDNSPKEEYYKYKLEDNNQSLYWYDIDSGKFVRSFKR